MRLIVSTFAILWLIVAGILIAAAGALYTQSVVSGMSECYGIVCDLTPLGIGSGVVAMVIGAGHVVAAVGIWRQRTWGERLGRTLAFGGLLFSLAFLSEGIHAWWVLPAIGYGVTLVVVLKRFPGAPGRLDVMDRPDHGEAVAPEPHDPTV